jgi:hypothetical protein
MPVALAEEVLFSMTEEIDRAIATSLMSEDELVSVLTDTRAAGSPIWQQAMVEFSRRLVVAQLKLAAGQLKVSQALTHATWWLVGVAIALLLSSIVQAAVTVLSALRR